jgi:hypothetical protein
LTTSSSLVVVGAVLDMVVGVALAVTVLTTPLPDPFLYPNNQGVVRRLSRLLVLHRAPLTRSQWVQEELGVFITQLQIQAVQILFFQQLHPLAVDVAAFKMLPH